MSAAFDVDGCCEIHALMMMMMMMMMMVLQLNEPLA
jgi:hypothetical protein